VVCGISDIGDRFRLTANLVDVVEPAEDLPLLPVACAVWKLLVIDDDTRPRTFQREMRWNAACHRLASAL